VDGGSGIDQYFNDLKQYDTVIMGKNTYEFGFKFGLLPGQPAYNHMEHFIFSNTANYENVHEQVHIVPHDISIVKDLKEETGSDIYLCGGSIFAAWLLKNQLIDVLKIKLNPVLFGQGTPLFSQVEHNISLDLQNFQQHDHSLLINSYKINY